MNRPGYEKLVAIDMEAFDSTARTSLEHAATVLEAEAERLGYQHVMSLPHGRRQQPIMCANAAATVRELLRLPGGAYVDDHTRLSRLLGEIDAACTDAFDRRDNGDPKGAWGVVQRIQQKAIRARHLIGDLPVPTAT